MIKSFKCPDTRKLFQCHRVAKFQAVSEAARLRLMGLNMADSLEDLRSPPGNRLEALIGERKGQHSIRVNKRWRICFEWIGCDAYEVEIVDYHK